MLPPPNDPRWTEFVQGRKELQLKCLASRIMYGQARLLAKRDPNQAVRLAYEYFLKNETLAAEDLKLVLGKDPHG
jgi:hypothetical protein